MKIKNTISNLNRFCIFNNCAIEQYGFHDNEMNTPKYIIAQDEEVYVGEKYNGSLLSYKIGEMKWNKNTI